MQRSIPYSDEDADREAASNLLVAMAKAASKSLRRELIFDPFPKIVDPANPDQFVFHPKCPYFEAAAEFIETIKGSEGKWNFLVRFLL